MYAVACWSTWVDDLGDQVVFAGEVVADHALRAYIESNLEFIRDNPNQLRAIVEIVRATFTGAKSPFSGNRDGGVHILAEALTRFQAAGDFRAGFVRERKCRAPR